MPFLQEAGAFIRNRLQLNKLSILMDFTYRFVPFYQKVFRALGALPDDIVSFEALKCFPVIDKSFVIGHYDEFIPRCSFPDHMKVSTGGSGSHALSLYWHPDFLHMKNAAYRRFESWALKGRPGCTMKLGSPFYDPDESQLFCKRLRTNAKK